MRSGWAGLGILCAYTSLNARMRPRLSAAFRSESVIICNSVGISMVLSTLGPNPHVGRCSHSCGESSQPGQPGQSCQRKQKSPKRDQKLSSAGTPTISVESLRQTHANCAGRESICTTSALRWQNFGCEVLYRVAKTPRIPYLYKSFSTKMTCI